MIFTRLGYSLIIVVMLAAAGAIYFVVRPPGSETQALRLEDVMNYSKFGVIQSIDQDGKALTVRFKKEFDTRAAFGTDAHVFKSEIPDAGTNIIMLLEQAGVRVNAEGAVQVKVK